MRGRHNREYRRECSICGSVFVSRRPEAKYCSQACRTESHRLAYRKKRDWGRTCGWCGEAFDAYRSNQVYCSPECSDRAYQDRMRQLNRARITEKSCPVCHKPFTRTVHATNQKFCSAKCQTRARELRSRFGLSPSDLWDLFLSRAGRCEICGRELVLWPEHRVSHAACLDHHHGTGAVRGILCMKCNAAIGLFEEDRDAIQRALGYLGGDSVGTILTTGRTVDATPRAVSVVAAV